MSLTGKAVLITGAGGGIGGAVVKHFVSEGARVVAADLAGAPGHAPGIDLIECDLSEYGEATRIVNEAVEKMGRLDVLIHCAALLERRSTDEIDEAYLLENFAINQRAPFLLTRAAAGIMRSQGNGRIILLTSQGAFTGGFHGSTVYNMSKAAVTAMMKYFARELAPHKVTVNAIAPSAVDTRMMRDGVSDAELDEFVSLIPVGRMARPEEIATSCAFLAGDGAAYITGHTLDVDGGQLMR